MIWNVIFGEVYFYLSQWVPKDKEMLVTFGFQVNGGSGPGGYFKFLSCLSLQSRFCPYRSSIRYWFVQEIEIFPVVQPDSFKLMPRSVDKQLETLG